MNKMILYIKNVAVALTRLLKAVLGLYQYHPQDGYLLNVLVVLDCLGNTLALGDPDETISSRSGKAQEYEQERLQPYWGWGCRMCSFLAVFQQNHCQKAIERNTGHRAIIKDES